MSYLECVGQVCVVVCGVVLSLWVVHRQQVTHTFIPPSVSTYVCVFLSGNLHFLLTHKMYTPGIESMKMKKQNKNSWVFSPDHLSCFLNSKKRTEISPRSVNDIKYNWFNLRRHENTHKSPTDLRKKKTEWNHYCFSQCNSSWRFIKMTNLNYEMTNM